MFAHCYIRIIRGCRPTARDAIDATASCLKSPQLHKQMLLIPCGYLTFDYGKIPHFYWKNEH